MASLPPGFAQPPEAGRVYLTFDDGPDPQWTPRILDILAEAAVPATFFLVGRLAARYPGLVRRLVAEGHAVGNHTWSHRHPWTMTMNAARREVRDGATAIADILGQPPRWFRPPHGRLRGCMVEEAERGGQTMVLWNRSAVDWGPWASAAGIAARLDAVQGGDIVLLHDGTGWINRPWRTAEVLPAFLDRLHRRNLRPARLG